MIGNFILFLKGIVIGVANIIPGVSGGTISVVLGIFDDLIYSINNLFSDFKKSVSFLVPICIGALAGIVALSSIIEYGLTYYSLPTNMLFAGLVAGSIPIIYSKCTTTNNYSKLNYLYTLIAFLILLYLSSIGEPIETELDVIFTPSLYLLLFFGGAVAAGAMIIPGISGSFLLMLMGVYPIVIHAIANIKDYLLDITNFALLFSILQTCVPLGLGVLVGIFSISKGITILLKKYHAPTYFFILGLVFGSIYSMFASSQTYKSGVSSFIIIVSVVTFIIGFVISFFMGRE